MNGRSKSSEAKSGDASSGAFAVAEVDSTPEDQIRQYELYLEMGGRKVESLEDLVEEHGGDDRLDPDGDSTAEAPAYGHELAKGSALGSNGNGTDRR